MLAEIINSTGGLGKIPESSAAAYKAATGRMVPEVNASLWARNDILEIIGFNPVEVMEMNHANHALFMSSVFETNSYELLAKTVPWVYRVYHVRGFSYDYFPVELKAWIDAINRHLEPAAARPLVAVYQWMLDTHQAMIGLSVTVDSLSFSLPAEAGDMQQIFLALLLHSDTKGCVKLAEQSIHTVDEMKSFYLQVITPALYTIGRLWEKNEISVAQEHLATAIVSRVMGSIYSRALPPVLPSKGKAVIAVVSNDYHEIGARMVSDFLEFDGWEVSYLGASMPVEDLLKLIEREKPVFVGISAAVTFNLARASQAIAAIRSRPDFSGVKIMAGGLAFNAVPALWRQLGADGFAPDCATALKLADEWGRRG